MQHSPRCRLINFSTTLWKTTCYLWKTGVFWGISPRPDLLKRLSSQGISAIDPSSWTLNVACPIAFNTMVYEVCVKSSLPYSDWLFAKTLYRFAETEFSTEQQAQEYLDTFQEWEHNYLHIEVFPF